MFTAAQTAPQLPTTLEGWADRLTRFGNAIPQEKVFVHMDNTCYFLGDTIWYAAYTRRTDKDIPSNISRVLYVELFNQDGYLVERQLLDMRQGRGHGNFVLPDTLYGGYYELRAYTRWQLNWGIFEKEHSSYAEDWFFNKTMAKEYYRDYDKIYSRVFPVYDKPQEPGDRFRDMTSRPMRRYFKSGLTEPQLTLTLFPEGGRMIAGVPCHVAFEAATESGEACEGMVSLLMKNETLTVNNDKGENVKSLPTVSRGRGVFSFTPEADNEYELSFTAKDGRTAKAKLPKAEPNGVALHVERKGDEWLFIVATQGATTQKELGLTVMREGVTKIYKRLNDAVSANPSLFTFHFSLDSLASGIHQVTVFDADGRIYADRLFFVTKPELLQPSLTISGIKEQYSPFEQVKLDVKDNSSFKSFISLSIRDAATQDYIYDNGNILTEMLLGSELKGFIPDPGYFFKADDDEHRTALDLLMMTQGWRRFDWHAMATPGAFELSQPAESVSQVLRGEVLRYHEIEWQDDLRSLGDSTPTPYQMEQRIAQMHPDGEDYEPERSYRKYIETAGDSGLSISIADSYSSVGQDEILQTIIAQTYAHESHYPAGSYRMRAPIASARFNNKERSLEDRELRVHAEFIQDGSEGIIGDLTTRNGTFTIQAPRFNGFCVFFLAASDTTRWKSDTPYSWISMDETQAPEFYLRINQHYPHFIKPYTFYQTAYRAAPDDVAQNDLLGLGAFEKQLQMVTVRAKHGGMRRLDLTKPAFSVDAYTAFNDACDAGLIAGRFNGRFHYMHGVTRYYIGDMGTDNAYLIEPRYDGKNVSFNRTSAKIDPFNQLTNLSTVCFFTDFNPRDGGDPRDTEDNVGRVAIDLRRLPDEGQRVTYRDRRYILQGFNIADDFYHPDYSQHPLPDGKSDYRRTLYWNPELPLDDEGHATVTFFTGSKQSSIIVEANGQASDGRLLTIQ